MPQTTKQSKLTKKLREQRRSADLSINKDNRLKKVVHGDSAKRAKIARGRNARIDRMANWFYLEDFGLTRRQIAHVSS